MLVFNLTEKALDYRGIVLKANGGSHNFRDMTFVPDRDLELANKKVLAFGAIPQWWTEEYTRKRQESVKRQQEALAAHKASLVKKVEPKVEVLAVPTAPEAKEDAKEKWDKKR